MKRTEIKHLLPGIFQSMFAEGTPLAAILEVMEALHAPSEEQLRTLEANFSPYRAPDSFVPFLARWVDLDRLFEKRLRGLVAAAAYLSQWRGTGKGLMLFLETATGAHGFAIEERVPGSDGKPRPFHFRVHAPRELTSYRALIQRIIESEKPAYVTYEIEFNGTARG